MFPDHPVCLPLCFEIRVVTCNCLPKLSTPFYEVPARPRLCAFLRTTFSCLFCFRVDTIPPIFRFPRIRPRGIRRHRHCAEGGIHEHGFRVVFSRFQCVISGCASLPPTCEMRASSIIVVSVIPSHTGNRYRQRVNGSKFGM